MACFCSIRTRCAQSDTRSSAQMSTDRTTSERLPGFSARLGSAIEHTGMSRKEFSERSGIPLRTLQNYIAGDREPGASALAKMASAGLNISSLLMNQGENNISVYNIDSVISFAIRDIIREESRCGEVETNIIERSGLSEQITKAAEKKINDLIRRWIMQDRGHFTFREIVENYSVYAVANRRMVCGLLQLGLCPPEGLAPMDSQDSLLIVQDLLIESLGPDAIEPIRQAIALMEEALRAKQVGPE